MNVHILLFRTNTLSLSSFFYLLFFFTPLLSIGQEVEIHGYLIDEMSQRRLSDGLIVNESSGEFVYADEDGNYSIKADKKDVIIFSALGYSSVLRTMEDSLIKSSYYVIPALNRYSIFIKEVTIQAEREVQRIKKELDYLTLSHQVYESEEGAKSGTISSPISAIYSNLSKREQRRRKVAKLKYLDRKRILMKELILRSRLPSTASLNMQELERFINYLLKRDHLLSFKNEYELLAFINIECKKWVKLTGYARESFDEEE